MKKTTVDSVQSGLQSALKFCNLHSGCTIISLFYMDFPKNPDCRMQILQSGLHSDKTHLYQQFKPHLRLYCRHPISCRDGEAITACAVLPPIHCVEVARAREVVE